MIAGLSGTFKALRPRLAYNRIIRLSLPQIDAKDQVTHGHIRRVKQTERMAAISGSIHALADADRRGEADDETERLRTALAVGRALESGGGSDAAIAVLPSALRARIRVTDAALMLVNGADKLYTASIAVQN